MTTAMLTGGVSWRNAMGLAVLIATVGCSQASDGAKPQVSTPAESPATESAPTAGSSGSSEAPASSEAAASTAPAPSRMAAPAAAASSGLPSLPGTNWQLLSFTDIGQPYKDAQNPADVEFLVDGTWGILHYSGLRESGKYSVKGSRLAMTTDDGEIYNDAEMKYNGGILELWSKVDLMRLGPQEKHNR